jgi:drug/metabolite transporter (DMT)-like permease
MAFAVIAAPSVCFLVREGLRMDPRVSGKQPWGAANLPRPMPPSRLLALYLCWGASVPAMKVMVETIPPLAGAAVVFLAGAGIVGMLAGGRRGATGPQLRRAALTGLFLLGGQGMATVALTDLSASLTAILTASNVLWAAVFARVAGIAMDRATVIRLLLGFAGITVVVLSAPGAAIGGSPLAVAAALGSSVLWGLGSVVAAHGGALPRDPLVAGTAQLLTGGVLLLVLAAAAGELAPGAWEDASPRSAAAAGFLLAFDSLAGFLLYTSLLRDTPLGLVGTYAYVVPLIAVALGVAALGDHVNLGAALGAAVAMAAVTAQLRAAPPTAPRRARPPAPSRPPRRAPSAPRWRARERRPGPPPR